MNNFLFEIGTEEMPASYVESAAKQMSESAKAIFERNGIKFRSVCTYATFRRLVLVVDDLSPKQEDIRTKTVGPPKSVSFDGKGNPTQAASGFARSCGVKTEDLTVIKNEKGEYLCYEKVEKGRDTVKILPHLMKEIILGISFPRSMRWPQGEIRFVRPIRWIVAIYDDKTVPFSLGKIKSSRATRGHKFIVPKPLQVKEIQQYTKILKNNYVVVDQEERKKLIMKAVSQIVRKPSSRLLEDEELLGEISYLVEYPTPVLGRFEEKYLSLPADVLIACMKKHQKCFSVVDGTGKLLPYFVGVRDGISEYMENVKSGYERVLAARLEDASFFFRQDKARKIDDYVGDLKGMVFQEKIGTLYDKVERTSMLAEYICGKIAVPSTDAVKRTAYLCKADLMTRMVKEFPELQGVMGREYARLSGEKETVARGIYEHYLPASFDDRLPETVEGTIVSIADKLDTVVGDFHAGLIPTGSEDPYGLRKQAHGIVRIMLAGKLNLSLYDLVSRAMEQFNRSSDTQLLMQVLQFFRQRVETIFGQRRGMRYDEINAVLNTGFSDLADTESRILAIHKLRALPDFEPITTSFKRAKNILKQAKNRDINTEDLHLT